MTEPELPTGRTRAFVRATLRGSRHAWRTIRARPVPTAAAAAAAPADPGAPGAPGASGVPARLGLPDRYGPCVDPLTFRQIMSAFPTGIAVVTSYDAGGTPRGLTCSALCSVSMDPPLLLLCVNGSSGSLQAIRASNGFVVNFLREGRDWLSQLFASPSPDKFAQVKWRRSATTGLPWLEEDTIAHADCRLVSDIEAGDHSILIGVLVSGSPPLNSVQPLLYWQRRYASWPATTDQRLAAAP